MQAVLTKGKDLLYAILPPWLTKRLREQFFKMAYSDRRLVTRRFRVHMGFDPNLTDPKTYNEKIQWLKLNWRDDLARSCADKLAVRGYVADRIGPHVLNRTYGVFDAVEDVRWDLLPQRFVVKTTHGSGWNILCTDRDAMDWAAESQKLRTWLRSNLHWTTREWVYQAIKPRLMIEEFLDPEDGDVPPDYKVFCFHGRPTFIQVDLDRFGEHRRNLYDTEWRLLPASLKYRQDPAATPPKPPLREIIEKSAALAEPFPHVRVDWFFWRGNLRFGEMTFFPGSGSEPFTPPDWDLEFGRHLDLARVPSIKQGRPGNG